MLRGYVLPSRRSAASAQIRELEASGVTLYYVEGKGAECFDVAFKSLRKGDGLAVATLADLALNRDELRERLSAIHDKGCYVLETKRNRDSRKHGIEMVLDAADELGQRRKGHDPKWAKKYGKLGGRPKAKRAMSREDAEKIWFDRRIETNSEALSRMTGWTLPAAYRAFGKSGRPAGKRAET